MENDRLNLKVTGHSMFPQICDGDHVLIDLEATIYELGDILLFKDSQTLELTVHRLIDSKSFLTKGDNSYLFDGENKNVIGKVIAINNIPLNSSLYAKLIAKISRYCIASNPLRYFFKALLILFLSQRKSYLKDS